MKKYFILFSALCISTLLTLPSLVFALPEANVTVFPPTESTVNGIPESHLSNVVPQDVIVGPIFYSYNPNTRSTVLEFRPIAQYDHDNTWNNKAFNMKVSISRSERQGSEWVGSVQFTSEIKAGILGGLKAQFGGSYKEYRETNEAVGVEGSMVVDPGKWGHIKFWYKGIYHGGTLKVYYFNTEDPSKKEYVDIKINGTTYRSDIVDVYSKAWQDTIPPR